jgi:hypothetical protein
LPEGKEKEKAQVEQAEYQWRLSKMALEDGGEDLDELVFAQLDKDVALASLPKIEQLITELRAYRDTLPAWIWKKWK